MLWSITPQVKRLILINAVAFVLFYLGMTALQVIYPKLAVVLYKIFLNIALVPREVIHGKVWQLFTYMFLHGGMGHILFNMLALWMFGSELEEMWGESKFLRYYLICGIGAGVITTIFTPNSILPTIGASGAIFGLLLAFGMLFPDRIVLVFFFFPMKAKVFVILFGLIEFLSSFSFIGGGTPGIAHLAHLGGMIVGYLYLKTEQKLDFIYSFSFNKHWQNHNLQRKEKARIKLDELLGKISREGFHSLTPGEKKMLDKLRNELNRGL